MRIGYTLSSEEFDPLALVKYAKLAENAGFGFLSISDHFHPWVDEQGQSPFVWSTIGALSQVTKSIDVLVAVTCPIIRIHPAIIAQAAATSQYMLEGRFILGVGTGENLNEHVVGFGWPPWRQRIEMLKESVEIMRMLWEGGYKSYEGNFYSVDEARIYTLPKNTIPVVVSSFGPKAAKVAGEIGDGYTTTSPDKKLINIFEKSGGKGKPKYGQMSVCYDRNTEKAKLIIKKVWPLSGLPKPLNTELKIPKHFENAAKIVDIEEATKDIPTGAIPERIIESIKKYEVAGFTDVYVHNIGPNQEEFIKFAEKEILPLFS